MAFDEIQFDSNSVALRSDLRILATIRVPGEQEKTIYIDSAGQKIDVDRSLYISSTNEPQLFKSDELTVVSNWLRFGGPNAVILPEGQRLLLGQMTQGTTVDVALWRKFIMAQTFTNRVLVAATLNGIVALEPKPGSVATPKDLVSYENAALLEDIRQSTEPTSYELDVIPSSQTVTATVIPQVIAEVVAKPSAEVEVAPKVLPVVVKTFQEPKLEPEVVPITLIDSSVVMQSFTSKVLIALSDALLTFAFVAIMYGLYQTVWSNQISQNAQIIAREEIEIKWKENPAAPPELHRGFALVFIPALKDKVWELPITSGVKPEDLIAGMGHYPNTVLPGEAGNFAITGHRSTYGEPLANVDQLKQNDEVIIKTASNWYVYKLILDAKVDPDATWVLDPNPGGVVNLTGNEKMISVITCDPRWGSTSRWVWWGTLEQVLPLEELPAGISGA